MWVQIFLYFILTDTVWLNVCFKPAPYMSCLRKGYLSCKLIHHHFRNTLPVWQSQAVQSVCYCKCVLHKQCLASNQCCIQYPGSVLAGLEKNGWDRQRALSCLPVLLPLMLFGVKSTEEQHMSPGAEGKQEKCRLHASFTNTQCRAPDTLLQSELCS